MAEERTAPPSLPTISFIGLGNMGFPMATNLAAAGYRLLVADARPEPVEQFVAAHPTAAVGSLPTMGALAQIVITMLPKIEIVREVMLGLNGRAFSMPHGSILIDMSSSSPPGTIALGTELAKQGISMVDAPVSGGVPRAITGELTIMAGGKAADVDRCEPILKAMGKTIFRTGKLGTGQAMKALNNLCSAAGLLIAAEAVRAGRSFGLDGELMIDVLNASTGQNNSTLRKFKPFVLPKKYEAGFGLDLMVKDISAALDLAISEGLHAPFTKCCVELWNEARQTLGPGQDHTAIDLWLERINQIGRAHV
jgi:3-hydroxyisobutyrate dehydrogenase